LGKEFLVAIFHRGKDIGIFGVFVDADHFLGIFLEWPPQKKSRATYSGSAVLVIHMMWSVRLLKPLLGECEFHEVRGRLFGGCVLNSFEEVRLRKRPYQWQEKTAAFARIPFVEGSRLETQDQVVFCLVEDDHAKAFLCV